MTQNPHNVPVDKIAWLKTASLWENPLKVVLGPSDLLQTEDGRPFVRIAELHTPDRCTYICHPDNFLSMAPLAKRIALGEDCSSEIR
jgi:hypothetical protein